MTKVGVIPDSLPRTKKHGQRAWWLYRRARPFVLLDNDGDYFIDSGGTAWRDGEPPRRVVHILTGDESHKWDAPPKREVPENEREMVSVGQTVVEFTPDLVVHVSRSKIAACGAVIVGKDVLTKGRRRANCEICLNMPKEEQIKQELVVHMMRDNLVICGAVLGGSSVKAKGRRIANCGMCAKYV